MDRFGGTIEPLCAVDVAAHVAWLQAIPLGDWPQQDRLTPDYPYPAMVSDPCWHGFKQQFDGLVNELLGHFPGGTDTHRMLSVVVPQQTIADHDDVQDDDWRVRIHVPLVSNSDAKMWHGETLAHLAVGTAYKVNTEVVHGLCNKGSEPRIHFFFDVKESA